MLYRSVTIHKIFGPASYYRTTLKIAAPVMLQQLIMSLVSLIDNFMVAGLGDAKMGAVNVVNSINFIYYIALFTLGNAGGIFLAQYYGAKNNVGMQQAYRFKVLAGIIISIAYGLLLLVIPEKLIALMTMNNAAQAAIIQYGSHYMRLMAVTLIPMAIASAIGSSYREIGKTTVPLVISIIATLINTIGNWILIYGNLGAPRLEVTGAAYATILARVIEMIAFLVYARWKRTAFFVPFANIFAIERTLILRILKRSWMMLLTETSWSISETVITALYNTRGGAEVVAGMAAGWTMANVFFLIFSGIQTAAAVSIGTTLGAGELDEARRRAVWIQSGAVVFGSFIGLMAILATAIIPLVFANLTPQAQRITAELLVVVACYIPLWSLLSSQFAVSRAGGDAALGLYVDFTVSLFLFIPAAWALTMFTTVGPVLIFALSKLTDICKVSIAHWYLKKERWVKNLTVH